MGKHDYHHNLGKKGNGDAHYGDEVNDPVKFCGNSLGAGKGDHRRQGRNDELYRKNFDKIDWSK